MQRIPVRWLPERGTWIVRIRDLDGTQVSKTFPKEDEADARDYAMEQMAKLLIARRAKRRGEQVGGRVLSAPLPAPAMTSLLVKGYEADLRARGRQESHLREVRRILDDLDKEVPNLGAPGVELLVETWANSRFQKRRGRTGEPLGPASRNKWILTVRGLCRWAMHPRRHLLTVDPSSLLELSSISKYLKPQFSIDELRRLLATTHYVHSRQEHNGGLPKRDPWHLMTAVMVYAGLRNDEAATLRWQDIDWSGGSILLRLASGVKLKRRKERIIPLQAELRSILWPHRQEEGRLFPAKGANMRRGFLGFLNRAKVPHDGRTPHSCRHSYAGLMTATGVPSLLLMAYMGHESVDTTEGYAQMAARYVAGVDGWKRGEFRLLPPGGLGGAPPVVPQPERAGGEVEYVHDH